MAWRGQGPGHSWVHGELRSPHVTGAEAEPHSQPLCLLLRLLAREWLPSLLGPNLSEKLFSSSKRQIN